MTGENLMIMLELRLDNVLFRLGFARTRKEARQIVDHKHVLVNGKCVNIPSYLVKAGDVIEIREKSKSSARYKEILESTNGRLVPEWLEADADALKGSVKSILFKEVIDLFEVGSRERKYVVLKLVNGGVLDISHLDPWDRALVAIPDEETEAGYIHLLGYKSHCPGSWTCKKREIERVIKELQSKFSDQKTFILVNI